MQNRKLLVTVIASLFTGAVVAQPADVIVRYINKYKDIAIKEMQRTGVPAAIKLAQGIHETMAGTSDLVMKSNNHFGIKCKETWSGPSVKHDDDLKNECFRKYSSAEESYRDHSDFLKSRPWYSFLFNLDPTDYKGWAYGLKKAGYATNPKYPQIIIKLIEDYNLEDYTLIAMGKMKPHDEVLTKAEIESSQQENKAIASVSKTTEPVFFENFSSGPVKTETDIKENNTAITVAQAKAAPPKANYPAGEFKINETRVIYAKEGTPLLAIAQQYNVSLAWLYDFNDLPKIEELQNDQLIYLQRKRKTGLNEIHVVKQGENLYDIAQKEAIRLESLREYNMLAMGMEPAVGEQLYLKAKAPARPRLAQNEKSFSSESVVNSSNSTTVIKKEVSDFSLKNTTKRSDAEPIVYTVQSKETIWAISKKYDVSIDDLVNWNKLQGNDLKAGQKIKIYK